MKMALTERRIYLVGEDYNKRAQTISALLVTTFQTLQSKKLESVRLPFYLL